MSLEHMKRLSSLPTIVYVFFVNILLPFSKTYLSLSSRTRSPILKVISIFYITSICLSADSVSKCFTLRAALGVILIAECTVLL